MFTFYPSFIEEVYYENPNAISPASEYYVTSLAGLDQV